MIIQCPACAGTGKVQRAGNRKAHVCHMCNGHGEIEGLESIPLFDVYSLTQMHGLPALLHQHSWNVSMNTMRALARGRGLNIAE